MSDNAVMWAVWGVISIADVFVIAHFMRSIRWKRDHALRR